MNSSKNGQAAEFIFVNNNSNNNNNNLSCETSAFWQKRVSRLWFFGM